MSSVGMPVQFVDNGHIHAAQVVAVYEGSDTVDLHAWHAGASSPELKTSVGFSHADEPLTDSTWRFVPHLAPPVILGGSMRPDSRPVDEDLDEGHHCGAGPGMAAGMDKDSGPGEDAAPGEDAGESTPPSAA